jgi:hypothetical protein
MGRSRPRDTTPAPNGTSARNYAVVGQSNREFPCGRDSPSYAISNANARAIGIKTNHDTDSPASTPITTHPKVSDFVARQIQYAAVPQQKVLQQS